MALHNDVFRQQIWKFFSDDLTSCLTVSKFMQSGDDRFKGGLNFTACLATFSVIEFMTGFYVSKKPTTDDIALFLGKYLAKYWEQVSNKSFAKKFYEVFRNGVSHQWSPKASGISMDFENEWILRKIIPQGFTEEILDLNIPSFYTAIINALKDFEKDLDYSPSLRRNFEARYNKLVENDYLEMRILRDKYLVTS